MKNNKHTRREFITRYLYGGTFLLGGALVFGCSSMKSVANDTQPASPGEPAPPVSAQNNPETAAAVQDTVKKAPEQTPKPAVAAKDPCDDMTGVSPEELEKRKKLAYVRESPIPDSHCGNCALYMPPAGGKPCGGCLLFKGPVRAEGYCAYWAPVNN